MLGPPPPMSLSRRPTARCIVGCQAVRQGPSQQSVHVERLHRPLHVVGFMEPPTPIGSSFNCRGGLSSTWSEDHRAREGRGRDGAPYWRERQQHLIGDHAMSERARIGFIGLGDHGRVSMAGTLARAGHALERASTSTGGRSEALEATGAAARRLAARRWRSESDIVFSSLPVPATVQDACTWGPTGFCKGRSRERSSST